MLSPITYVFQYYPKGQTSMTTYPGDFGEKIKLILIHCFLFYIEPDHIIQKLDYHLPKKGRISLFTQSQHTLNMDKKRLVDSLYFARLHHLNPCLFLSSRVSFQESSLSVEGLCFARFKELIMQMDHHSRIN